MIGQKFGSYELVEEIGRGGMAVVYRAYQPNIDRHVAVKVISKDLGRDPTAIERFQREARLIARLEHPHILPLYDFDGGHIPPYIVMRHLVGGTLQDFIKEDRLDLDNVIDIFNQVCSSIDYAHRQGVVHRDLKPSNILIDLEGNAFVTDFGIARMVAADDEEEGEGRITGSGALVGTPEYMSPEQITSESVDHRADIYSLGVLLFQMMTGHLPFESDSPAVLLSMHLQEPAPSVLQFNLDLPPPVDEVLARAMAKDREDRFSSVSEFADSIIGVFEDGREKVTVPDQSSYRAQAAKRILPQEYTSKDYFWTPVEHKRSVTALYVDITALAAEFDEIYGSKETKKHLDRYWREIEEAVAGHGGSKIVGNRDSLFVLWGSEQTREDDAERAVKAGLAVLATDVFEIGRRAVSGDGERSMPIGIGVNSGMILLSPDDQKDELGISGPMQITAQRLAQEADGSLLIARSTYSQVKGIFDVHPHSLLKMPHVHEPVQTYEVERAKPRAFRILTRGIEGIETRMVGREAELQILKNAFLDAVEDEETQIISIISSAGLGKSRLLYEFSNWAELQSEVFWLFRSRSTAEIAKRPYALLRDLLMARFEILDSDSPDRVREKLEAGIEEQVDFSSEIAPVLGQLAGFDFSENQLVKGLLLDPFQLAARGKQLFSKWIQLLCRQHPVVVELDDIHYADDASLDMISYLVNQNEALPLLVIGLARESLFERRPNWGSGMTNHTKIELRPLDKRSSRGLVREILQKVQSMPRVLRDLLVDRAEGNPYYLEELVKMLIDQRVIIKDDPDEWRVEAERLEYLPVPATLSGLLQSSLDSLLYPEKLTLERAAVIGRIFYTQALEELNESDVDQIQNLKEVLRSLVAREVIFQREMSTFIDSKDFLFRSVMFRDMILNTIPKHRLKRYHLATTRWLVNTGDDRVDEFSDRIAYHYSLAGDKDQAADWYLRAAERAASQGAYQQSRQFFDKVLEANKGQDLERNWQALLGRNRISSYLGDSETRLADEKEMLSIAKKSKKQNYLALAHYRRGFSAFDMGQFRDAVNDFNTAIDAAEEVNDLHTASSALSLKVFAQSRLGDFEEASKTAVEAMASAEELGDEYVLALTLNNVASLYSLTGDRAAAIAAFRRQADICRRLRIQIGEAKALLNLGYEYVLLGVFEEGLENLERSLAITESIEAHPTGAYCRLNLGLASMLLGSFELAQDYLQKAGLDLEKYRDAYGFAASKLYLAYTWEAVGDMKAAKELYTEAARLLEETGVPGMNIEAKAGIARCFLVLGNLDEAEKQAAEVWDPLTDQGAQGIEFPILVYLTCANVFKAAGAGEVARKAVVYGKELLEQRAKRIMEHEWRSAYLNNFPEHVAILAMFEEADPGEGS